MMKGYQLLSISLVRKITITLVTVIFFASCGEKERRSVTGSLPFDSTYFQNPADSMVSFPKDWPESFGYGRTVLAEEISAWDIDVMPDGTGLPAGSGTVSEGSIIYKHKCTACHGATGIEGPFDKLVGREPRNNFPFGKDYKYSSMRTIGNYWPYATTLFDYIRRAMPQNEPGSLTADEVYALSAYLLHLNEIVPSDAVMDLKTLPAIEMPARDRFVMDNRRGGREIR
jgi:cytochrome c